MAGNVKVRPNRNMLKAVQKIVGANMDIFATRVVLRARKIVVRDTGNLARNIRAFTDGNVTRETQQTKLKGGQRTEPQAAAGLTVQTTTGYGAYIELGTSKMAAQPFLAPAVQETANDLVRRGKLYE